VRESFFPAAALQLGKEPAKACNAQKRSRRASRSRVGEIFRADFHVSGPSNAIGATTMSTPEDASLERELDMLMAKAGAVVPADRKAGVIAGYRDMKRMCALLRQPRTAADEPSNIYSLKSFVRSKRS
jgi:hypothetical protein